MEYQRSRPAKEKKKIIIIQLLVACIIISLVYSSLNFYSLNKKLLQLYDSTDAGWDVTDDRLNFLEDEVLRLEEQLAL